MGRSTSTFSGSRTGRWNTRQSPLAGNHRRRDHQNLPWAHARSQDPHFAKDDSRAEDIVHIVRGVFGKGNDFAKKITYKSYNAETMRHEKSDARIQEFRTSTQLRIAVTVT